MAKARKEASHSVTFAKGGKGHMFGQQAADAMAPGTTRDKSASDTGQSDHKIHGGKGKMFGFQPSNSQVAGRTSSY